MRSSATGRSPSVRAMPSYSFHPSPAVEPRHRSAMPDKAFRLSADPVDPAELRASLADRSCGGYASFEGWVRDHNEGRRVTHLEYEAFEPLAVKEGERVLAEAVERFGVERVACVHRVGDLALGDMAVWVGVSARHRHEAFLACRYIIDEVKHRLPIWKKEHYE